VRESKIQQLLDGVKVTDDLTVGRGEVLAKKGQKLTAEALRRLPKSKLMDLPIRDTRLLEKVRLIIARPTHRSRSSSSSNQERIELLRQGDELPPGVIKAGQGVHRHEAQAPGR